MKYRYLIISLFVLALTGLYAYHAKANIFGSSLVGWWTMDSNRVSGTTVTDSSSRGATGTNGAIVTAIGQVGQAMVFDGTVTYVELGAHTYAHADIAVGTNTAWFKLNALPASGIVMTIFDVAGFLGFQIQNTAGITNVQGRIYQGTTHGSAASTIGTTALVTGKWYFYSETWDGSNLRVYLNGKQENSVAAGEADQGTDTLDGTYPTRHDTIGRNCEVCTADFFNGPLDDVRLYNRALSQAEIMQLYQSGKGLHLTTF